MAGLNAAWAIGLGLPILALYLLAIALTRALRAYSRSLLEEVCEAHGRPARADEIAHQDEKVERAAEALALLCGLLLVGLLIAQALRARTGQGMEVLLTVALAVGALGHVLASVAGRVWAERLLDATWPVAAQIPRALWPLTTLARGLEQFAYRRANGGSPNGPRPASVEVEIHHGHAESDDEAFDEADLPEVTRQMLERAVELADRDVAAIMTPRSNIVALPASVTAREAASVFSERGMSRIPLYGEHRDDIIGILYAKDLFARMLENEPGLEVSPRKLARMALFVPESKNATELLEELRKRRVQMAIVLDEYGGVAGLITLEDLLEEIVGSIDDEHDIPTPDDPVVSLGGSQYELDASMPLEDLNERLDLNLPAGGDFQTVGGLAFDILGRVPEAGATFRASGVEFTVLEVVDHSIRRLRLDVRPTPTPVGP